MRRGLQQVPRSAGGQQRLQLPLALVQGLRMRGHVLQSCTCLAARAAVGLQALGASSLAWAWRKCDLGHRGHSAHSSRASASASAALHGRTSQPRGLPPWCPAAPLDATASRCAHFLTCLP